MYAHTGNIFVLLSIPVYFILAQLVLNTDSSNIQLRTFGALIWFWLISLLVKIPMKVNSLCEWVGHTHLLSSCLAQ